MIIYLGLKLIDQNYDADIADTNVVPIIQDSLLRI